MTGMAIRISLEEEGAHDSKALSSCQKWLTNGCERETRLG